MGCTCDDNRTVEQLLKEYLCAQVAAGIPAPQIDVEHRTICNEDTNTWHYVTVVYTNGVAGPPTVVDSGIACSEPLPISPDIEKIEVCDETTNTIHVKTYQYSYPDATDVTNVTETLLSDVDTNVPCNGTAEITKTHSRSTGQNTFTAPYKSLSVTAISDDVTIDGQLMPQGLTVTVGNYDDFVVSNNTVVDGTDYFTSIEV